MIYGLSKSEVCLLCETLNGTIVDRRRSHLLMEVTDAIRLNHLDRKWDVGKSTIQAKLESLEDRQVRTLLERISKFWEHSDMPTDDALHAAELDVPTNYLLNSAVISAGAFGRYDYREASTPELERYISEDDPVSRIGYQDTCRLIEDIIGHSLRMSRAANHLEPGERGMVVRLKYRLAEPGLKSRPTQGFKREDYEIGMLERIR